MSRLNLVIVNVLFFLIFTVSLEAAEGSGSVEGSEGSAQQKEKTRSVKEYLLKSLGSYENVLLKAVGTEARQSTGTTQLSLSASNPQGDKASFNVTAEFKSNPQEKKSWIKLTGDIGEALIAIDGEQGKAFLPLSSVFSTFDMNEFQPQGAEVQETPYEPKEVVNLIVKNITEFIESMDDNNLSWEPSAGGNDIIVGKNNGAVGRLFISQDSFLINKFAYQDPERKLNFNFNYSNGMPTSITGDVEALQGPAVGAEFQVNFKYADGLANRIDFRVNAKAPNDVRVLFQVNTTMNHKVSLTAEEFQLTIDSENNREVPLQTLGQNLMMGAFGKLMGFQRLLMPMAPGQAGPADSF